MESSIAIFRKKKSLRFQQTLFRQGEHVRNADDSVRADEGVCVLADLPRRPPPDF